MTTLKRFLLGAALAAVLSTTVGAAEEVRLKLSEGKFKVGEGTPSELVTYDENEGKVAFYAPGTGEWKFKLADDGAFNIVVRASCDAAQDVNAKFKLTIDGKAIGEEVTLSRESEHECKLEAKLGPGEHTLAITFTNDAWKDGEYDRNLYIHSVTLKPAK
jgi:hypothetical protein